MQENFLIISGPFGDSSQVAPFLKPTIWTMSKFMYNARDLPVTCLRVRICWELEDIPGTDPHLLRVLSTCKIATDNALNVVNC